MIIIAEDKVITGEEIHKLRSEANYGKTSPKEWDVAINQALLVVSARDTENDNKLIGVGFVVGNNRHAQLVDLVVHPDYRKQGIGGQIFDQRVEFCQKNKIRYVGLTYDTASPWLKEFYAGHGFREIDFAMWHKDSLKDET
jgi:GNAT superfamily N-acetyltransferase